MYGIFGMEITIHTIIYGVCVYTVLANPALFHKLAQAA